MYRVMGKLKGAFGGNREGDIKGGRGGRGGHESNVYLGSPGQGMSNIDLPCIKHD